MLLSPRIAGLREHGGERFPATWPGIITPDAHIRLVAMQAAPPRPTARRYLLTGLATCGLCGAKLVARPRGDGRRSYVCASDMGGCGKIRALAAPLEEFVARAANARYEELAERGEVAAEGLGAEDALRQSLAADEAALDDLARDRYVLRAISQREFLAARDELVERIAAAQRELAAAENPWAGAVQLAQGAACLGP